MRRLMHPSVLALVLAAAVALPSGVAPALAKKPRRTPCSGHFPLDSGEALVRNATSTGADSVDVAGKLVTIGGSCSKRGSLRATHNGWRLQVRWSSCGDLSRPRLTATIGFDCQKLTGTLRAKHWRRRFTAHLSACDAGAVAYAS